MAEVATGILYRIGAEAELWLLTKEFKQTGEVRLQAAWSDEFRVVHRRELVEVTDHSGHNIPIGMMQGRGVFDIYHRATSEADTYSWIQEQVKKTWATCHYYMVSDTKVCEVAMINKKADLEQVEALFRLGHTRLVASGWWTYDEFLLQGNVVKVSR